MSVFVTSSVFGLKVFQLKRGLISQKCIEKFCVQDGSQLKLTGKLKILK